MSASQHPSIQGLIELARRDGVDIRPTLLRVLADLYVQEPTHPAAERARFAELACRLLDGVDAATRAAVAERLAPYPSTPAVVTSRLARDEIRVADPILRRSPVLAEAEMHAILDTLGVAHAVALASRKGLPVSVAERLRRIGKRGATPPRPTSPADGALTLALARRFLVTGGEERRLILMALPACAPVANEERLRRIEREFGERLERAALRHQAHEFADQLRSGAGLPLEIGDRITADTGGEPIVAVCRALELPFNMTSRILLFLNPLVGASVQQVFALAENFERIAPTAARRLVAAWCELIPARMPQPKVRRDNRRDARDTRAGMPRILRAVTPARPASASEA